MVQVTGRAVASHALRAYVPGKFTRSVLSILCIISAGVIGAVGVVCFIFCSINPRNVIINIYLIIFAVLIILSELGFSFLLKRFAFLDTFFGRGIFYIFVGLLAVDTHWFQVRRNLRYWMMKRRCCGVYRYWLVYLLLYMVWCWY
jgi:hypothetical protein